MDRRILWLAFGAFATSTVAFAFAGLLPLIAASAGIGIPEAGHLITAFSLAYAIGTPIMSALLGAAQRRKVIALALTCFVIGNVLAATSVSFTTLLLAQIVMGASAGLFAATAQATAIMLGGPEHRARSVATVLGGTTLAVAIGAPLGALIGHFFGWRATFLFIAAIGAFCLVVLWLQLPKTLAGVRLTLSERFAVIGRPGVLSSLGVTFLYITGAFTLIGYMAPLGTEGAGMSGMAVPAMLLVFGIGAVVGNYASGQLADRLGPSRVVSLALCASIVICLAIAAMLDFLPHSLSGPLLIAIMLPWGFIGWTFPPAQASRLVALAPALATLTMPLNVSAMYFGIALGSFIGGRVLQYASPIELGYVAAVFPLAALLLLGLTTRRVAVAAAPAE